MSTIAKNVIVSQVNAGGTQAILTFNGSFIAQIKRVMNTFGAYDANGALLMTFPQTAKVRTGFGKLVDGENYLGNVIKTYREILLQSGFPSESDLVREIAPISLSGPSISPALTQTFELSAH